MLSIRGHSEKGYGSTYVLPKCSDSAVASAGEIACFATGGGLNGIDRPVKERNAALIVEP